MANTSAICNSFKQEVLVATHNFTASTGNTFKLALFDILWGGFVYFISCYLLKYIEKTK